MCSAPSELGQLMLGINDRGDGQFTGQCHASRVLDRAYGGALLAQLVSALYTQASEDQRLHSLHAYFLRGIVPDQDVNYQPTAIRKGRTFTAVSATAEQAGAEIGTMLGSFKKPHPGSFERVPEPPTDVLEPLAYPDAFADRPTTAPLPLHVECREAPSVVDGQSIRRDMWVRLRHRLSDNPAEHVAGIAYLSDFGLAPTALLRFGPVFPTHTFVSSLDHSVWFHHQARADEWLLYRLSSRIESDSTTFGHGELWTEDGALVASVAQEALMKKLS